MSDYDAKDYNAGLHRLLDALLAENAALKAKIARVEALAVYASRDWRDMGARDDRVLRLQDVRAALADESAP